MNLASSPPISSSASASAGAPARGPAAQDGDAGGFSEVLERQLQRAGESREADAAPADARTPQDLAEREAPQADALPLIAAALESRSLARSEAVATATADVPARRLATASAQAAEAGPRVARASGNGVDAQPAVHALADSAEDAATAATQPGARARSGAEERTLPVPPSGAAIPSGAAAILPSSAAAAASNGVAAAARPGDRAAPRDASAARAPLPTSTPAERAAAHIPPLRATPVHEAAPADAAEQAPLPAASATTSIAAGPTAATPPAALAAGASAPAQGFVAPEVASRTWGPALGQEVARLHHAGHGQAQLELNPPGLGPLSVSLSVTDQQAHAAFVSSHASVRAAIEAALPQLRSALADNGISLGEASVGAEHRPGGGAFPQPSRDSPPQRREDHAPLPLPERPVPQAPAPRPGSTHRLDTFA